MLLLSQIKPADLNYLNATHCKQEESSPLVVTGFTGPTVCSAPAKLLSAFSTTFPSSSRVPLPSGPQPFPLRWVNHTRRRQHRRDPSSAGAAGAAGFGGGFGCSAPGRDGATVRAASAGPQSCIPRSPRGRWASGSARGSPNRPQVLLCPSQLQLRKVNFGTQSSVFIGIMNSRNCFHVRARTSFQGVCKGHSVW